MWLRGDVDVVSDRRGVPSGGCIHMHYQLPVEWWSEMLRARHRAVLW